MPINRRVVGLTGMSSKTFYRPENAFVPYTWVTPAAGLYRGDVGMVLGTEYETGIDIRPDAECLIGFLPQIVIPGQQYGWGKRVKKTNQTVAPTSPVESHNTLMLDAEYVLMNTGGFPVPVEQATSTKRKHRELRPRVPKIYQGYSSFPSFTKSHLIPLKKLRCYKCSSPEQCSHTSK